MILIAVIKVLKVDINVVINFVNVFSSMESQTEPVRMYSYVPHTQQTSRKVQNTESNPDKEKLNK